MIADNTTFGFEAEWATNMNDLVAALCGAGYLTDSELHGYHCDCDHCRQYHRRILRAQTDSSCAGELISGIFVYKRTAPINGFDWPDFVDLADTIEIHAMATDTEPGPGAGCHVHARHAQQPPFDAAFDRYHDPDDIEDDGEGLAEEHLDTVATMCAAHLLCLPLLTRLAKGRHTQDHGRNASNYSVASDHLMAWLSAPGRTHAGVAHQFLNPHPDLDHRHFVRNYLRSDRHSLISYRSNRFQTIEYRLWRSTRMAWRIHLYVTLSMLLTDPAFWPLVIEAHGPETSDTTLAQSGWFREFLEDPDLPPDTLALFDEQVEYAQWAEAHPHDVPSEYSLA